MEQRAQGLDDEGLARLLNDQKDSIAHALPAGLASDLGSTGLLDGIADRLGEAVGTTAQAFRSAGAGTARTATAAGAAGSAAAAARQRTSGGGSWLRWLIGLLVLALLAWLIWQYLLRDRVEEEAVAPTAPATVEEPAQD